MTKMYSEFLDQDVSDESDGDYNDKEEEDSDAKKAEAVSLTDDAIALAEAEDPMGALELFEKAVELDPSNARFHENLGVNFHLLYFLLGPVSFCFARLV